MFLAFHFFCLNVPSKITELLHAKNKNYNYGMSHALMQQR